MGRFAVKKPQHFARHDSIAVIICDHLVFISLIITTGSIFTRSGLIDINSVRGLMIAAVVLDAFFRMVSKRSCPKIEQIGFFLLFASCFCLSLLVEDSIASDVVLAWGPILVFCIFANFLESPEEIKRFLGRFVNIAVVIAAISLVFFLLGSCLHWIRPTGIVEFQWDQARRANSYYGIYFEPQTIKFLGYEGFRNCAFFSEAPMFAFIVTMALALEVLLLQRRSAPSLILGVTIITTFSTTAYVGLFLIVAVIYIRHRNDTRLLRRLKYAIVPILSIMIIFLIILVFNDKSSTGSYSVRSDHLQASFRAFFDYFPLGAGFGNAEAVRAYCEYDQGLSVGIPYYVAIGGIFAVLALLLPSLWCFYRACLTRDLDMVACLIIFLFVFFVTNVVYNSMLQWMLLVIVFIRLPSLIGRSKTR